MSQTFGFETTAEEVAKRHAKHITGKNILITGCTLGGLGAECCRVIAKHEPGLLVVAGRRLESITETINQIKLESPNANLKSLIVDLASLESVRNAAQEVLCFPEHIDVLINNAAVFNATYTKTQDGYESQFGTNHLGPFLFTNLIMSKILANTHGESRIINVSSAGHIMSPIRFEDPFFGDGNLYDKYKAYGQSKTANILFTRSLIARYHNQNLLAFSLHPGSILTNLQQGVDIFSPDDPMVDYQGNPLTQEDHQQKTVGQGAATHIVAAFDPSIKSHPGSYLQDCQIDDDAVAFYAKSDDDAARLWALSEKLVGSTF
ncbi:hypothetical protein K7432_002096 [Basidiobolus ranarum]|uniref:Short-chain dehydrogenase n=1 Tax=Basidiobolus ranarum TaxID=34480 RepID=A0ABR2X237_9FUNG